MTKIQRYYTNLGVKVYPEHQEMLEQLISLLEAKKGIRTDKSKLTREAIEEYYNARIEDLLSSADAAPGLARIMIDRALTES